MLVSLLNLNSAAQEAAGRHRLSSAFSMKPEFKPFLGNKGASQEPGMQPAYQEPSPGNSKKISA